MNNKNDDNKAFTEFVSELLHIDDGFRISRIERTAPPGASICIYLEYQLWRSTFQSLTCCMRGVQK